MRVSANWPVLAVAAFPGLVFLLIAGHAAAERAGLEPLAWRPANIVEAAAAGDAAYVLRDLRRGVDPRRALPVAPDVLPDPIRLATPLEAAVWSRRLEPIEVLERNAGLDGRERAALACLALDWGAPEIARHLAAGADPICVPGRALAEVEARTTGVLRTSEP
jgi:hypothetical protein